MIYLKNGYRTNRSLVTSKYSLCCPNVKNYYIRIDCIYAMGIVCAFEAILLYEQAAIIYISSWATLTSKIPPKVRLTNLW